jgi:hypothetical protein
MIEPAKNRLHPYAAGWLTLLFSMRVATEEEARAAMSRVAPPMSQQWYSEDNGSREGSVTPGRRTWEISRSEGSSSGRTGLDGMRYVRTVACLR